MKPGLRITRAVIPNPSTPKPSAGTVLHMGTYGNVKSLNEDNLGNALHYRAVFVVNVQSKEEMGLSADAGGTKLNLDDTHLGSAVWIPSNRMVVGIVLRTDNNGQTIAAFLPALKKYFDQGRAYFDPKPVSHGHAINGSTLRYC